MLEAGFSNSTGKTHQGALLNHRWPDLPPGGSLGHRWKYFRGSISEELNCDLYAGICNLLNEPTKAQFIISLGSLHTSMHTDRQTDRYMCSIFLIFLDYQLIKVDQFAHRLKTIYCLFWEYDSIGYGDIFSPWLLCAPGVALVSLQQRCSGHRALQYPLPNFMQKYLAKLWFVLYKPPSWCYPHKEHSGSLSHLVAMCLGNQGQAHRGCWNTSAQRQHRLILFSF